MVTLLTGNAREARLKSNLRREKNGLKGFTPVWICPAPKCPLYRYLAITIGTSPRWPRRVWLGFEIRIWTQMRFIEKWKIAVLIGKTSWSLSWSGLILRGLSAIRT